MSATDTTIRAVTGRHRRSILIGFGVALVLVVLTLSTLDDAEFDGALDPRNPEASGAQAVARVLDAQGVYVTVVRGQDALLEEQVDANTTVAVTNPESLGPSTLARLETHASGAGAMVLIGNARSIGALVEIEAGQVPRGRREASCDLALAERLVVRTYGGEGLRTDGCFGTDDTSVLAQQSSRWLFTSPSSISNRRVLEEDNAALAVRLLGQQERLVWYVADATDLEAGESFTITELLPPWLGPSMILLVFTVLGLMLWRGRRLGPLVTEPLPVVVRAVESTQARGRTYRRAGDRAHAATILVEATRRRLTHALGLPPRTSSEAVADAVAARAGRDPAEVRALLCTTPTPDGVPTNARLADLARRLIDLENEVSP